MRHALLRHCAVSHRMRQVLRQRLFYTGRVKRCCVVRLVHTRCVVRCVVKRVFVANETLCSGTRRVTHPVRPNSGPTSSKNLGFFRTSSRRIETAVLYAVKFFFPKAYWSAAESSRYSGCGSRAGSVGVPGENPGEDPGADLGADPGAHPGEHPGEDPE